MTALTINSILALHRASENATLTRQRKESAMKIICISEGQRYSLNSYGNGWGYLLKDKQTGLSVWLQDDDAAQFREELETLESRFPDHSPDDILGILWHDYDYGQVAREQEEAATIRRFISTLD